MKAKKGTKCEQGKKIPENYTSTCTGKAAGKGKCGANHLSFVSHFKMCSFLPTHPFVDQTQSTRSIISFFYRFFAKRAGICSLGHFVWAVQKLITMI